MKLSTLALAGAIALSAAGGALAQPAPPPGSASAGPDAHRPDAHRHDPAKMAEAHAARLRAVLQLRPDQEPALRALVEAMKPGPGMERRRDDDRGELRNLPTPQRLDRMQARMNERQAQFARRADAIKGFYAQLTPAQQRAFDALHDGPDGMRGGPRHRHGHGPDHGAGRDLGHGPEHGPSAER